MLEPAYNATIIDNQQSDGSFKIYLKDFLSPGGRYPYDDLAPLMERFNTEGKKIGLVSVPGFLMGTNWLPDNDTPLERPWSNCHGTIYKTAADLLADRDGEFLV